MGEPLPDDYYYDAKTFARELPETELPASFAPLYHSFAFESNKRSNLHYLDEVRHTLGSRPSAPNRARAPRRRGRNSRRPSRGRTQPPAPPATRGLAPRPPRSRAAA